MRPGGSSGYGAAYAYRQAAGGEDNDDDLEIPTPLARALRQDADLLDERSNTLVELAKVLLPVEFPGLMENVERFREAAACSRLTADHIDLMAARDLNKKPDPN